MKIGDMVKVTDCPYGCWDNRYGIIEGFLKERTGLAVKIKTSGYGNITKRYDMSNLSEYTIQRKHSAWVNSENIIIVKKSTVWKRMKKLDMKLLRGHALMLIANIYGVKQVVDTGNTTAILVFSGLFATIWAFIGYRYYNRLTGKEN